MCVYVCMNVCVYVCVCIDLCARKCVCARAHECVTDICVCLCVRLCVCAHLHTRLGSRVHLNLYTFIYLRAYVFFEEIHKS